MSNYVDGGRWRRRLMLSLASETELPSGAIPCEQIFSDGYSVFIESGIVPTRSMSFEYDAQVVRPTNVLTCPIGYYLSNKRYSSIYIDTDSIAKIGIGYNNYHLYDGVVWGSTRVSPMRHFKVTVSDTGSSVLITENGEVFTSGSVSYDETAATFSTTYTLSLLGRKKTNNTTLESGTWRGGMGRTKLYSDDRFGTLLADYIPCYYNGNFGFWDKISSTHLIGTTPGSIFGFGTAWNTKGFSPNCRITNSGTLIDYRGACVSPLFSIPQGCNQIRFNLNTSTNTDMWICFYKSDKSYSSYYTYNALDRVVSVPSNAAYIRATCVVANLNTCYLYDETNSQYIWKGIEV